MKALHEWCGMQDRGMVQSELGGAFSHSSGYSRGRKLHILERTGRFQRAWVFPKKHILKNAESEQLNSKKYTHLDSCLLVLLEPT